MPAVRLEGEMAAIPLSTILKLAATATLALITCVAFSVASGDGVARAKPLDGWLAQENCVFLIF